MNRGFVFGCALVLIAAIMIIPVVLVTVFVLVAPWVPVIDVFALMIRGLVETFFLFFFTGFFAPIGWGAVLLVIGFFVAAFSLSRK